MSTNNPPRSTPHNIVWCLALIGTTLFPSPSAAHAMDSGIRLLLPTGLTIIGGTLAVAASVLIVGWMREAWMERLFRSRDLRTLPTLPTLSLVGLVIALSLIAIGFFGPRDPLDNLLPLTVWTIWWVGFTCLCAVFGNLWQWIEPWSGVFRLARYDDQNAPLHLPEYLGITPAILALMAFGWFENADIAPQDPARLATLASAYLGGTFVMMALFGPQVWLRRGECFSVFFDLVGSLAPLTMRRHRDRVEIRTGFPGHALLNTPPLSVSHVVFVLVALATISFDGLSETFLWLSWIGINPLEFPGRSAVITEKTIGFLAAWAALSALFIASCALGARLSGGIEAGRQIAGTLAGSILPIAVAYHFAHYLMAFLVNVQFWFSALRRDHGAQVTTSFLYDHSAVEVIWWAQSGAIIAGHVLAVLIAHAALTRLFRDPGHARRAGFPVAILMIFYTCFGLWLLATPSGA